MTTLQLLSANWCEWFWKETIECGGSWVGWPTIVWYEQQLNVTFWLPVIDSVSFLRKGHGQEMEMDFGLTIGKI